MRIGSLLAWAAASDDDAPMARPRAPSTMTVMPSWRGVAWPGPGDRAIGAPGTPLVAEGVIAAVFLRLRVREHEP